VAADDDHIDRSHEDELMRRLRMLLSADDGNAMVEFAMILPVFIIVVVGGMYLALLGFTVASMHYAVQAGARCASLGTTVCTDNAATAAFTKSKFWGTTLATPTFSVSTAACGHLVSGSITASLKTGFTVIAVPIRAQSCFP
jgi:Flp pilus assembly protein TadG